VSEIDIKRWEIVINKKKSLLEKEIVKLENEIVISEIVVGDHLIYKFTTSVRL
jgi:hypothetical protein